MGKSKKQKPRRARTASFAGRAHKDQNENVEVSVQVRASPMRQAAT
jgi:hypothetical protein